MASGSLDTDKVEPSRKSPTSSRHSSASRSDTLMSTALLSSLSKNTEWDGAMLFSGLNWTIGEPVLDEAIDSVCEDVVVLHIEHLRRDAGPESRWWWAASPVAHEVKGEGLIPHPREASFLSYGSRWAGAWAVVQIAHSLMGRHNDEVDAQICGIAGRRWRGDWTRALLLVQSSTLVRKVEGCGTT